MTAYTSASSGNWSAGSTWDGGLAPVSGAGHTVTIDNGNIVTADVNWDIGSSPPTAGTAAITVTGTTGKLIIGAGVTLVVRGDVMCPSSGNFTMNAGSVLEFNASGATDPTNQHYRLNLGTAFGTGVTTVNGTSGAHCTIRSVVPGGGTASIVAGNNRYYGTFTYCDFNNLGTASISGIQNGLGGTFDLSNCIFDTCGKMELFAEAATTSTSLVNVTMKNTVSSACMAPGGGTTAVLTSGTRLISGCVFDKTLSYFWRDYTITNTIFSGTIPLTGSGAPQWTSFTNNLLVWSATSDASLMGSATDCYCLANHATTNPHWLTLLTGTIGSVSISGCVFDSLGTDGTGDCITVPVSTGALSLTIEHNLVLPNVGDRGAGTLFSSLGGPNVTFSVRHNTIFGGQSAACMVTGETYAGHAGMITAIRDNLCWDTSARVYKAHDNTSTVIDVVASANIHHNAGYLMNAGSNGKGYNNFDFSSDAPGANDVDGVNPDFVDPTRKMKTWDASLAGGAGSVANALTELKKKNEAGYNPAYTIAALLAWVKAGFIPRATALQAASDSVAPSTGWIGALQGVGSGADKSRLLLLGVGA